MKQPFYSKLEAEYTNKLKISWLMEKGWLKSLGGIWHNRGISWGKNGQKGSIEIDVSLEPYDSEKYIEEMTEPSEFDMFVRFKYILEKEHTKMNYKAKLTTTPCNFGGWRYWFECLFCNKRIGVLYYRAGYFACRHCQNITYEARNLSGKEKAIGRTISIHEIERLEEKVGRKYYKGKFTKSYLRYLKKRKKFSRIYSAKIGLIAETSSNRLSIYGT